MAAKKKTAKRASSRSSTSSRREPTETPIPPAEPGAASEINASAGKTEASMGEAPLGTLAGEEARDGEHEQSAEEAFGEEPASVEVQTDPAKGRRLLQLIEIGERQALKRATVPAPDPLWDADERMLLELLAPSAAQAFSDLEPPRPKLALALLLGVVTLHTAALVAAHRGGARTVKQEPRNGRAPRDMGRASDVRGEASRVEPGAVGFPPTFGGDRPA